MVEVLALWCVRLSYAIKPFGCRENEKVLLIILGAMQMPYAVVLQQLVKLWFAVQFAFA